MPEVVPHVVHEIAAEVSLRSGSPDVRESNLVSEGDPAGRATRRRRIYFAQGRSDPTRDPLGNRQAQLGRSAVRRSSADSAGAGRSVPDLRVASAAVGT